MSNGYLFMGFSDETITAGQTTLNAKLLGLSFPIPLPSNDICQTITCPVQSGQTVVFDYAIPVPAFTPQVCILLIPNTFPP